MRKTRTVMVSYRRQEYLRLMGQTAKRLGVQDLVAILLIGGTEAILLRCTIAPQRSVGERSLVAQVLMLLFDTIITRGELHVIFFRLSGNDEEPSA